MYDQEQISKASVNPAARFKRPIEVVEAIGIPAGEKLTILKAWEADERALQRAEDEGMGGGEHAHLHRVHEALGRLAKAPLDRTVSSTYVAVRDENARCERIEPFWHR